MEVDLILTRGKKDLLIEIKSTDKIDFDEVKAFARNTEVFGKNAKRLYVSQDLQKGEYEGVICLHWTELLDQVFGLGHEPQFYSIQQ